MLLSHTRWDRTSPAVRPKAAVAVLVRDGVDASRRRGRRVIERKLSRACFYCGRAQRHRPETDNETYVLTLMGALRGFFRFYDPVFAADDRKIGCDYPTVLPVAGLFGIDHIEEYAKRIYFESLFLLFSLTAFSLFFGVRIPRAVQPPCGDIPHGRGCGGNGARHGRRPCSGT